MWLWLRSGEMGSMRFAGRTLRRQKDGNCINDKNLSFVIFIVKINNASFFSPHPGPFWGRSPPGRPVGEQEGSHPLAGQSASKRVVAGRGNSGFDLL
jgi:hypothetical protein